MKNSLTALAAAACIALPAAAQQPKVSASPYLPSYGQPVTVEVRDTAWPTFTPATRYSINGSNVIVDFEYLTSGFGPMRPDFGYEPVNLGELVPGNYTLTARLHNIQTPGAAPLTVSSSLAVVPPGAWGLYTIPVEPQAFAATHVMVKSAAYFDPRTMRASISGNVVRVDFEYLATAPASGSAPAGMAAYGSVRIPDLAPGSYRLEGWGRVSGGAPEKFFARDLVIASTTPVVEYYSASLDHYFMATGAGEIAALDRGSQGDWKRTGMRFKSWSRQADAGAGAVPICRFYARGPNSHFFTGSKQECDYLKALEQQQRADAAARGTAFLGWGYEGIAFWAMVPVNGQCPAGTTPIYRVYNDRAAQNDSNHRFTADPVQYSAMMATWIDEGAQLCSPS